VHPAVEKRQRAAARDAAAAATFEALAREWHESQRRLWSTRHAQIVLSGLEKDVFPKLGTLPITAVTTPLVLSVLRPIETRGANETAHRTRRWISEVFARAIAFGLAQADPAAVTRRALAAEPARHRLEVRVTEDEIVLHRAAQRRGIDQRDGIERLDDQIDLEQDRRAVVRRDAEGARQPVERQRRLVPAIFVPALEQVDPLAPLEHRLGIAEGEVERAARRATRARRRDAGLPTDPALTARLLAGVIRLARALAANAARLERLVEWEAPGRCAGAK
jgi:hypothetical protein